MGKRDRIANALARRPVDRMPIGWEKFWDDTLRRWTEEGHLRAGEDLGAHFDMDIRYGIGMDCYIRVGFEPVILEETEDTALFLDGNGAKLRKHKKHASTPEHVGFAINNRAEWEEKAKPFLVDFDKRRVVFDAYRELRKYTASRNEFFCWGGLAPFELMHKLCGHETMLMNMASDPEWVADMVMTYSQLIVRHLEAAFDELGNPDGLFLYEDMGFKEKPFFSPGMYETIMQPGHALIFEFAHSRNLPVIVHSCGFVESLVPGLIDAGMDCLQAMEVKAGMDVRRLFQKFGDRISFYGGVDIRCITSNDRSAIKAELRERITPVVEAGGGYILHSDHSIPPNVDYDTYRFFLDQGREIGFARN